MGEPVKYFAYGSNMNPERMRDRRVIFSNRELATLKGYSLRFNKVASAGGQGYANIIRDENGVVEGALYLIDENGLNRLDGYEGCPDHYYRDELLVQLSDGRAVKAITYLAQPDRVDDKLKPSRAYLAHLLAGKDILSEEYFLALKATQTTD